MLLEVKPASSHPGYELSWRLVECGGGCPLAEMAFKMEIDRHHIHKSIQRLLSCDGWMEPPLPRGHVSPWTSSREGLLPLLPVCVASSGHLVGR